MDHHHPFGWIHEPIVSPVLTFAKGHHCQFYYNSPPPLTVTLQPPPLCLLSIGFCSMVEPCQIDQVTSIVRMIDDRLGSCKFLEGKLVGTRVNPRQKGMVKSIDRSARRGKDAT